MTAPQEYQRATDHFYDYLVDLRDIIGFTTTNPAYTATEAVFRTFRRRVSIADAIRFATVLPAGLRALFVADWDPEEPRLEFTDRATMTREIQSLRPNHNYSPDSAISDVARAVRKHVDQQALERVLARMPPEAADFWSV
ncbi:MAG TPA: DUF2267 domain-containing protein [Longimicrobiales bacterium]|nr:DUF2267 domain-containing protein [Longimicrobiales bacterium]